MATLHEYLLTLNKSVSGVWGLHTQKVHSQLAIWCNCCPRPTTAQCVGVVSRSKTVRRRVELCVCVCVCVCAHVDVCVGGWVFALDLHFIVDLIGKCSDCNPQQGPLIIF